MNPRGNKDKRIINTRVGSVRKILRLRWSMGGPLWLFPGRSAPGKDSNGESWERMVFQKERTNRISGAIPRRLLLMDWRVLWGRGRMRGEVVMVCEHAVASNTLIHTTQREKKYSTVLMPVEIREKGNRSRCVKQRRRQYWVRMES